MRFKFRFATPRYYTPFGNWFLGYWNMWNWKGYPMIGFRVLGLEFWIENWKE